MQERYAQTHARVADDDRLGGAPFLVGKFLEREGAPTQVVLPYFRARKIAIMTLRSEAALEELRRQAE